MGLMDEIVHGPDGWEVKEENFIKENVPTVATALAVDMTTDILPLIQSLNSKGRIELPCSIS